MKNALLNMFLTQLMAMITPAMIKNVVEAGLEWMEKEVKSTATGWDDAIVIPLVAMIRSVLSIEAKVVDDPALAPATNGDFNKFNMIASMLTHLFAALPPTMLKGFVDAVLDVVEDTVKKTETTLDDGVILPLVELVRSTFDIPDNDPVAVSATLIQTPAPAVAPAA